jgi:pimeloyl-ACP methyl ester carboxylesterase
MRVPQGNVAMLPNAKLHVLEGLNHFPQTQSPKAVNDLIEEFHKQLV